MATHSNILAWRVPIDRGSWQVTVCWVIKSWTWLSDLAHSAVSVLPTIFESYTLSQLAIHFLAFFYSFFLFFIYFIEWLVYSRILGYIHSKQNIQTLHLSRAYISLSFSAPDRPLTSHCIWRGDRHHSISTSGHGLHSQQSPSQTLPPYSYYISLRFKYISYIQPQPLAALVFSSSGTRK